MIREIAAGGVVVRRTGNGWEMAVIEPQKEPIQDGGSASGKKKSQKLLLALPKGIVDTGEKSTIPFGKASNNFCDFFLPDALPPSCIGSFCGSITAISQPFPVRRTTTPPAEISRIMLPNYQGYST